MTEHNILHVPFRVTNSVKQYFAGAEITYKCTRCYHDKATSNLEMVDQRDMLVIEPQTYILQDAVPPSSQCHTFATTYCLPRKLTINKVNFRPLGAICQTGSSNRSRHYYAKINQSGTWFECNDEEVLYHPEILLKTQLMTPSM